MAQRLGLNLQGGAGWDAGADALTQILARRFAETEALKKSQLDAQRFTEEQRQFDAVMPLRERGMAVDEGGLDVSRGNLDLRNKEFGFDVEGRTDAKAAGQQRTIDVNNFISTMDPSMQQSARAQTLGIDFQKATPPDTQGTQQRLIELENLRQRGQMNLAGEQGRQSRLTNAERPTAGSSTSPDDKKATAQKMLSDALGTVQTLKKMPGMSGAVGAKGPMSLFGMLSKPIAGSSASNYRTYYETLKGQLTLPNLQAMRGMGAMSDRDLAVIQSAMTALSTDLDETQFMTELGKLENALTTAQSGGGQLGNGATTTLPTGWRKVGG